MLMMVSPGHKQWKAVKAREKMGRQLMRMVKWELLVYAEEHGCPMEPEATKGEIVEELLFQEFGF